MVIMPVVPAQTLFIFIFLLYKNGGIYATTSGFFICK